MLRRLLAALLLIPTLAWGAATPTSVDVSWTAPTTSADGTPLTDLAGYRLYLSTPCPSLQYAIVPSPTSAPGPSETVGVTVNGLLPSTTYTARITAVDFSGNESACSTSASGMTLAALPPAPATNLQLSFGQEILVSFPTTAVVDAFNRADENPLSDGSAWSNPGAGLGVTALQLSTNQAASGTGSSASVRDVGTTPNLEAYMTVTTLPGAAGVSVGLFTRSTGADATWDGYEVAIVHDTGAWALQRVDNAAPTTFASGTFTGGALAAGDAIGMTSIGSTHTVWLKRAGGEWTKAGTGVDATYSAHGSIGMLVAPADATVRYDNFGGGEVADSVAILASFAKFPRVKLNYPDRVSF